MLCCAFIYCCLWFNKIKLQYFISTYYPVLKLLGVSFPTISVCSHENHEDTTLTRGRGRSQQERKKIRVCTIRSRNTRLPVPTFLITLFHFFYMILSLVSMSLKLSIKTLALWQPRLGYNPNNEECLWKGYYLFGNYHWNPTYPPLCIAIYWYRRVQKILVQIYSLIDSCIRLLIQQILI